MPLWLLCLNAFVINGENIYCANIGEVRLAGIDAPDGRDTLLVVAAMSITYAMMREPRWQGRR